MGAALRRIGSNLRRWTAPELLELAASVIGLFLVVRVFGVFATAVELRPGIVLRDPVLALLTPRDMTGVIFAVMYLSAIVSIATLGQQPHAFIVGVRAYAFMVLLRIVVMAATPFDAPPGTIPLADPVVQRIAGGQILTRDLFFSGHTATMCLIAYTARSRALRALFTAGAVVVGAAVLLQAVHYTVDVLAAPVFAYAAYRFALATSPRTGPFTLRTTRPAGAPELSSGAGAAGASGGTPPPIRSRRAGRGRRG